MSKEYFSKNLRFLRSKRGMEQLELAQMLGRKSASSISEWESGNYTPKVGILSDIVYMLNSFKFIYLINIILSQTKINTHYYFKHNFILA